MLPADEASVLFSTYHARIYGYVLSLVHNPSEAEDLTQDTFLRAYSHRDLLRDPNAVRGWLYRIATRVCLDRLRQRVVQVSIDGEEGERRVASFLLTGRLRSRSPNARRLVPACSAVWISFPTATGLSFYCMKLIP